MKLQLNELVLKVSASQIFKDNSELARVADKVLTVNSGNHCFSDLNFSAVTCNIRCVVYMLNNMHYM